MDPGTALILCIVLGRYLVNRWEDRQAFKTGMEPPRWTKAKARAAESGRGPAREYRSQLWGDAWDQMKKKHAVKHGERFARWEERRRRRAERRAARKAAKTPTGDTAPTGKPDAAKPGPEKKPEPASGGPAPETTGAIPPMTSPVPVPPDGEINTLPALVARTNDWSGFHTTLTAAGDSARAGAESWQHAAERGVISAEASLSCLATHKVTGSIPRHFTAGKEHLTQMADLEKQIAGLQVRVNEHNTRALEEFKAAAAELPGHEAVREAYKATGDSAGSKEFNTGGG